jgi:hypothetical protein
LSSRAFHRSLAAASGRHRSALRESTDAGVAFVIVLGSLDFVYVPTPDVDITAERYVEELGAELVWKVRGAGTVVACLRLSADGPDLMLSGHLEGDVPILIYRVDDYAATVGRLREAGIELHELEIPHGPCASFTAPGGQRLAVYELTRPGAADRFAGRIDG